MDTLVSASSRIPFALLLAALGGWCAISLLPHVSLLLAALLVMMPPSSYLTRIIPALSVVAVVVLLFAALVLAPYGKSQRGEQHAPSSHSQLILSIYIVLLHIPSVLFPARVCWAIGDIMKKTRETAGLKDDPKSRKTVTVKKGQETMTYPSPLFVIIVPAYKEAVETLEETLRVLASHPQARHAYHVRPDNAIGRE